MQVSLLWLKNLYGRRITFRLQLFPRLDLGEIELVLAATFGVAKPERRFPAGSQLDMNVPRGTRFLATFAQPSPRGRQPLPINR